MSKKKNSAGEAQKKRLLITVNVLGSAGPMRFVVNEDDVVTSVIDSALKSYSREGRLPILGTDPNDFLLYCANAGSDRNLTYLFLFHFLFQFFIFFGCPNDFIYYQFLFFILKFLYCSRLFNQLISDVF